MTQLELDLQATEMRFKNPSLVLEMWRAGMLPNLAERELTVSAFEGTVRLSWTEYRDGWLQGLPAKMVLDLPADAELVEFVQQNIPNGSGWLGNPLRRLICSNAALRAMETPHV